VSKLVIDYGLDADAAGWKYDQVQCACRLVNDHPSETHRYSGHGVKGRKASSCIVIKRLVLFRVAGWKSLSQQVAVLSRCLAPSFATQDALSIRVVTLHWQLHAKHLPLTATPASDSLDHQLALSTPRVFEFTSTTSLRYRIFIIRLKYIKKDIWIVYGGYNVDEFVIASYYLE